MIARLLIVVVLFAVLPAAAAAQTPGGGLTTARQISRLMTGETFEPVMTQAMRALMPMAKAAAERELKRELTMEEATGLVMAFRRAFEQVYPRTAWEEETARVLTTHLNDAELTELLQFYGSPLGRKLLTLSAPLMQTGERLFKSREQQFSQHLMAELTRELQRWPR